MKLKRIVEEIVMLEEGVNLEDVSIENNNYDLIVKNKDGRLNIEFYQAGQGKLNGCSPEFAIRIRDGNLHFERYVHRPMHDHNDSESLQVVRDEERVFGSYLKKGDLKWSKGTPSKDEGLEYFKIPFGSRTDESA